MADSGKPTPGSECGAKHSDVKGSGYGGLPYVAPKAPPQPVRH